MSQREVYKNDYTEDELENLKHKKCWCGKPRQEFDKFMRVYCCKSHREQWYERTISWTFFRDRYIKEHGKKCVKCETTPNSIKGNHAKEVKDWYKQIKSEPKLMELVEEERIKKLNEIEESYGKIFDENQMIDDTFHYGYTNRTEPGVPEYPKEDHWAEERFEVDHKLAVSLGGDMWDKKNLQVLCVKCHKVKTSEDMKKLKAKRRKLVRFDDNE